jgi:putative ABC transport system substrate-binding protein
MNRRRAALAMLAGIAGSRFGGPCAAAQQAGRVYRIGYLSTPNRASVARGVDAFVEALARLGWVEGRNIRIEYRWAEGDIDRLPELAAELVRLNVDVIVAPAGSAALAAKAATASIPVVMIFAADPVAMGLVSSLQHPGGNVTGTTFAPGRDIFGKQLQLLKEAIPRASRIAFLWNPADASSAFQRTAVESASTSLRVPLERVEARGPEDFERTFVAMAKAHADALLVGATSTYLVHQSRLAELALKARLPTMLSYREGVEAGGLMAYAVNMANFVGRSAAYIDKVLKGARPADLPIEQPTKFELVINLRTAKALGVALAPSLLQRADEVIQ